MHTEFNSNTVIQISVIIPFFGNKQELAGCFSGLQHQDFNQPFEIIIAETGNDPDVKKLIDSVPNTFLISSESVMFPGKARNIGVLNSRAGFLAFIDADCVPSTNWLSEIYRSLKTGNEIVIGPIINLFPFHPVASVDNLLQFIDFQKYRKSTTISHFPACNLGITKELFTKSGGFPEKFATGEDVIFSEAAIRNCNERISFNPRLVVRHSGRRRINQLIKHNENLGFHRGFLSLKISNKNIKFRNSFLFSCLFGLRRFAYITIRTIQWNPAGIIRIIFYLPLFILGLAAWVKGFWKGNQKLLKEEYTEPFIMENFLK